MAKSATGLHRGAPLNACPRCGSLVAVLYCARCGEPLAARDKSYWFQVQIESAAKRTAREVERLDAYPGRVEVVGSRHSLTVDEAGQIDWLRTNAPRLLALKNTLLLLPGGRTVTRIDPVFECLLGTMESGIRGCMTQRARVAHCHFESTLLPLNETMKSHSLADQLSAAGYRDLARDLVLGVLSRLHRQAQRAYCPLFGRALRLDERDAERLPFLLADALAGSAQEPRLYNLDGPSKLSVRQLSSKPQDADRQTALALRMRQRDRAVHPRAEGGYDSVKCRGPALVFRYVTDVDQRMVDFMVANDAGDIGERVSLQAEDADLFAEGLAVLRVDGRTMTITEHIGPLDGRTSWLCGQLPPTSWQLCRWRRGWYFVWSDDGAGMLLSPDRGWLLTAGQGEARSVRPTVDPTEFNGVSGAVRCGENLAILSGGGHRLTVLGFAKTGVPLGEPPVHAVAELILPHPARGVTAALSEGLLLADEELVFGLPQTFDRVDCYGPVESGSKVLLLAGRAVFESGTSVAVLGPGGGSSKPDWPAVVSLIKKAVARGAAPEPGTVTDRQGRAPHKSTWGG